MKAFATKICLVCFLLMPFLMQGVAIAEEIYDVESMTEPPFQEEIFSGMDPNIPPDVNSLMDLNLLPRPSVPGLIEGTG